ncbi:MAG: hypothetical protein ACOCUH_02440 [Bacteriovoracia bacterium]
MDTSLNKMNLKLLLLVIIFLISSCSLMPHRSFEEVMQYEQEGMWVPGRDFPVTAGDTGKVYRTDEEINRRVPASEYQAKVNRYQSSLEKELSRLENSLNEEERVHYYRYASKLNSTSQRIYFLSLNNIEERNQYLQDIGLRSKRQYSIQRYPASQRSLGSANGHRNVAMNNRYDQFNFVEQSDQIALGMRKDKVQRIWGSPERIEVAGNPAHENERWVYVRNGRPSMVYFERGKVEGWNVAP